MIETRSLTAAQSRVRVERRGTDPPYVINGYGAVFYDSKDKGTEFQLFDDMVERLLPGCFDRAAREDDCRALFNHDPSWLLGRVSAGTLKLFIDRKGLRYEFTPPDTEQARTVVTAIDRRELTGSSFSFMPTDTSWDEGPGGMLIREIRGLELYDISPVTFPAYAATTVGLRCRDRGELRAEFEEFRSRRSPPRPDPAFLAQVITRARCVELGF